MSRVWCIAELAEANKSHMQQTLKMHSYPKAACLEKINNIDVRNSQATYASDKELVLNKISCKDTFNQKVQNLLLQKLESHLDVDDAAKIGISSALAALI
jgi:hypothetical protein